MSDKEQWYTKEFERLVAEGENQVIQDLYWDIDYQRERGLKNTYIYYRMRHFLDCGKDTYDQDWYKMDLDIDEHKRTVRMRKGIF